MNYVETVADILADMRFCADQMIDETERAHRLFDTFKMPAERIGEVHLRPYDILMIFPTPDSIFRVMDNGVQIGWFQVIKTKWSVQFRLDIFGRTRYSIVQERSTRNHKEIIRTVHELFDYFGLVPIIPA